MNQQPDACDLLDADLVAVDLLFSQYRALIRSRTKPALKQRAGLAREICLLLTVQARLEREVFYPVVQAVMSVTDILAEAQVHHECAHFLMTRIAQKSDVDAGFDALVNTLFLYVQHRMHKERSGLFPAVRASRRLDQPLLRRTLEMQRQAILLEEGDKVAARMQEQAREKAARREFTLQAGRTAARARRNRAGAVVIHTLALREVR